jgi:[1-hydroxy-2-(trimethylamino)ethyl]phosphonate dioxygenase
MKIDTLNDIVSLYARWGNVRYSEAITQTEHAVQCARLAEQDSAGPSLVLAALLHDIGHLVDLDLKDGHEITDVDTSHETTGGRVLSGVMPVSVRNPIVLHVKAKRWLCSQQKGYFDSLSPASINSLRLQGGPYSYEEAERFSALPGFDDAIALRLWDDIGKIPDWGGDISEFEEILSHYFGLLDARATP